jgi:UDP-N-acetylmuramoyl-tripeptide--D-alanyl-D-alanine ligase
LRALDVLRDGAGRRVAVLGEMLELGVQSIALHKEVGRAAAAAHVDLLIAIGGEAASALIDAAVAAGLALGRTRHLATSEEAADVSATLIQAGDLVLVKGSHGVRTDKVVDRLKTVFG